MLSVTGQIIAAEAFVAQPAFVVQGQGRAALGTETDVVAQVVQEDLVDLIGDGLPLVVEGFPVDIDIEGLGKGKEQVELAVEQLQLRQGPAAELPAPQTGPFRVFAPAKRPKTILNGSWTA